MKYLFVLILLLFSGCLAYTDQENHPENIWKTDQSYVPGLFEQTPSEREASMGRAGNDDID